MAPFEAVLPEPLAPLVLLLEQTFGVGNEDDAALAAVPEALWNRALLDPLREFLGRPSKEFRARLLELGFRLGGGAADAYPRELPLIIEGLHAGSLIIDDIEDDSDSRRGAPTVHRRHGVPVALNAGNWLYFWAQVLLSRLPLADATRLVAHERLAGCLLRCHEGQALDLTVRVDELPQAQVPPVVRAITVLKTGSLVGLATFLGALAADAGSAQLESIAAFGRNAGVGLQMLDDLSGIVNPQRRAKAIEDLQQKRATWVWAWLAEDLPAPAYQNLRGELGDTLSGAAADSLVEALRLRLGRIGLARAHSQLERASDELRAVIGDGPWRGDLRAEFALLEKRYVQG